ncbi:MULTISPECIES: Fur family transcriptional regulator [unclassified Marinomonas]|uniref:Fur family transcriptional regulator n=1 Tax=unclassified Marinomonas TaxID=196814 RepID=UPI000A71115E|nr:MULTISPECIES: transcriptional repressor [unclassified Marinomonas]
MSVTHSDYKDIVASAANRCKDSGGRLTVKREEILKVLLASKIPLSAYEVLDLYKEQTQESMPPMSVYRILEFLEQQELIHRLGSQNKFIACSHIKQDCAHQVSQFLICRNCQSVKEVSIAQALVKELNEQVKEADYQLLSPQLELDCICSTCLKEKSLKEERLKEENLKQKD